MSRHRYVTPTTELQPDTLYDARCEDYTVAVRSLFRLARAGRWRECFAQIGLGEEHRQELFQVASALQTNLPSREDVVTLSVLYPWIDTAAKNLVKQYVQVTAPERYGKVALKYA